MSRHLFDLPPLETLVAFEAAARHLSFTRAGDEIALTQSAVSRQIQSLEERLGTPLFRRLHRALELTDAGAALLLSVRDALGTLDRTVRTLRRADAPRAVVVTSTAGFAGLWLIPRLSSFVALHPGIDVRISATNAIARLDHDGVDVAVRYQPIATQPVGSIALFGESVSPVCAPRLLRTCRLKVPADLARATLLRMETDSADPLQDWGLWLQAMRLESLRPANVLHFSSYDQLISAAIAGQGVALGRMPLIADLLKAKKLVAPCSLSVASPRGYALIVAPDAVVRPEVAAFCDWLTAEARGPDSARRADRARA